MRNGALITKFPGVTWFVGFTIPGISEILVATRRYAERSIGALICPTTGAKFLNPANPLAIQMLGHFLSVEIQARGNGVLVRDIPGVSRPPLFAAAALLTPPSRRSIS